jgi:Ca2+-dependent lipid-binding protein
VAFTLRNEDDKNESTVEISTKFIPVHITLEPRESTNSECQYVTQFPLANSLLMIDQGSLRVDLIEGRGILAADRSGKSDPYAVFTLNDQKVFRSQVKKKTLTPDWNEAFDVSVVSEYLFFSQTW